MPEWIDDYDGEEGHHTPDGMPPKNGDDDEYSAPLDQSPEARINRTVQGWIDSLQQWINVDIENIPPQEAAALQASLNGLAKMDIGGRLLLTSNILTIEGRGYRGVRAAMDERAGKYTKTDFYDDMARRTASLIPAANDQAKDRAQRLVSEIEEAITDYSSAGSILKTAIDTDKGLPQKNKDSLWENHESRMDRIREGRKEFTTSVRELT